MTADLARGVVRSNSRVRSHRSLNVPRTATLPDTSPTLMTPARFLSGVSFLVVIMGASRWGTQIGHHPIYVSDVLITLSILHVLLLHAATARRSKVLQQSVVPRRTAGLLLTAFLGYAALRILLSFGQSPVVDWARDSAPFLYAALAYLSAHSIATSTRSAREATMKLLWIALLFHLAWVLLMVATGNNAVLGFKPPLFEVAPFQLRHDFDGALIAILAGLALRDLMLGRRVWRMGLLLGLCSAAVAGLPSRASLIGLMLALSFAALLTFAATPRLSKKRVFFITTIPVVLTAAIVGLISTTPGLRLLATINPALASNAAQVNALGTRNAREQAWRLVIDWTNESPLRALFGGGFGNDFLTQSGAVSIIEGTAYTGVRSPHDYFVGVFARLGWVGLVLAVALVARLIGIILRHRAMIASEPVLFFAAIVVVAIIPVALFGVVLEAPFGAIPFFWSAGVLLTLRKSTPKIPADQPHAGDGAAQQ